MCGRFLRGFDLSRRRLVSKPRDSGRGVHGNGEVGSHGSYGIPTGMGVRSAMGWEWDRNGN